MSECRNIGRTAVLSSRWWLKHLKVFWEALGSPLPKQVRWFRYDILGRWIPVLSPRAAFDPFLYHGNAVSVVVAARNNGLYLRDSLLSIQNQTLAPKEIVYCDDGSDDQSVDIASGIPGIRVLSYEKKGVVFARNAGMQATTGEYILFVDGDDLLSPTYIETQLAALVAAPNAAFAYGEIQTFGLEHGWYPPPPWDVRLLWKTNFVNTSSLLRREAILAVGGWRDLVHTLWDWDLFLRIARRGYGVPCTSVLQYRRTAGAWTYSHEGALGTEEKKQFFTCFRRKIVKISICMVVQDASLPWVSQLSQSLTSDTGEMVEMIIIDATNHGAEDAIRSALKSFTRFAPLNIIRHSQLHRGIADAYNRLLSFAAGDVVWCVGEHAPLQAGTCDRLLELLLEELPLAVAGVSSPRKIKNENGCFPADLVSTDTVLLFPAMADTSVAFC